MVKIVMATRFLRDDVDEAKIPQDLYLEVTDDGRYICLTNPSNFDNFLLDPDRFQSLIDDGGIKILKED